MILEHSKALTLFKREIGQANHLLITTIIGLDGIIPYNVEANSEFHVSWNPKDKKYSIERSKVFIKKSALAWVVDCIDMYLRIVNQKPFVLQDENLKNKIDFEEVSRSVYKRINIICDYYQINSISFALVDLLICWRNRLIHYQADNNIMQIHRITLEKSIDKILVGYCGLDINSTIKSFEQSNVPTFKEVASLIKATIDLIYEIDNKLIKNLELISYADQIFITYFKDNFESRLNNIFSKDQERKKKALRQLLKINGFSEKSENEIDEFCDKISRLNSTEAKIKYNTGSFID